jgi:tetratricopeptide (TPR) repeat protein
MSKDSAAEVALERGMAARRESLDLPNPADRERRLTDAKQDFEEAAGLFRKEGERSRLAYTLSRQAQVARDRGRHEQAAGFQAEALSITRDLGDGAGLPLMLRGMADILQAAGRRDEAAPLYAEMMSLYRANPATAPLELANAVRSLAKHEESRGNLGQARVLWSEARDLYAKLDEVFLKMTGSPGNPGVKEAERRLAALKP